MQEMHTGYASMNHRAPCATEGEKLSGACTGGKPPQAGLHADGTLEKLRPFLARSAEGESAKRESLRQKDKVEFTVEPLRRTLADFVSISGRATQKRGSFLLYFNK